MFLSCAPYPWWLSPVFLTKYGDGGVGVIQVWTHNTSIPLQYPSLFSLMDLLAMGAKERA